MSNVKQEIKLFLPPIILKLVKKIFFREGYVVWEGNYESWEKARKASTGYDSEIILDKVKESLLKVKAGEVVYERDSVIFNEIRYSWPLLAALMWIAAQSKGELNIIDFGGSLGSTYFQNKKFLEGIPKVRWNIVEQSHFVDEGKKLFEDNNLRFFYDVETCVKECAPNTIIFSSVIQYLEKPYELLEKIIAMGFDFILFDRTPFVESDSDRLTIQKVTPPIYLASYPCWFFSKRKFYAFFEHKYELIARFEALDRANIPSTFEGCIFRRK